MADDKKTDRNAALVPLKDDKGNVTIHNKESDKSVMPRNRATDHTNPARPARGLGDDKLPFNVIKDEDGNLSVVNPESIKGGVDPAKDKGHRERIAKDLAARKQDEQKKTDKQD